MPRPKRHHFVPQWHLEGFTDLKSGVLHAYDKTSETYWTPKPKNIMVIKDYNRQKNTPEGIYPDILETRLGSSIEPEAQRAFKKLLSQPAELTPDDSGRLLTYLVEEAFVARHQDSLRMDCVAHREAHFL